MNTTVPVRLYPTPEQAAILRAHCQEYISTINVLVAALDSDVLPDGGKGVSTKDFTAMLPSAVKNQAFRDARSIWNRSFALGVLPVLRKPICQWNNQNWRIEGDRLLVPVCQNGKVQQISIRCALLAQEGTPGLLRIKRKRNKWIAEIAYTLPEPESTTGERIMGVDLGIKVPAAVHIIGSGTRYVGNGRMQRAKRRQFYAHRKDLQQAGKVRAVRKSRGKEQRWMRNINHKLSHQVVTHAHEQGAGRRHYPHGATRWHPPAHGTHKPWGESPQKQPHDRHLDVPPTRHLHRLQGEAGRHRRGMGRPSPYQPNVPCVFPPQQGR